jgi:hypothetical protein
MRTREKQRIYKRFMKGWSTHCIALDLLIKAKNKTISNDDIILKRGEVEQAIRDSFKAKMEFYESWTEQPKRKDGVE